MSAPQEGGVVGDASVFPEGLESLADEYEYLREIGSGGMAAVHLARERESGRLVAIKAIRKRYLEDDEALLRFAREARVLADLHHPNIVETYAVRELGEKSLAIVMQHLSGGTLRQLLRREGQLSFDQAASILRDVAEALRHAHAQGVVHRDVKPENIFLEDGTGRAVLSDFGVARPMIDTGDEDELTLVGAAIGTPAYMSPEQIDGLQLDGRSDVYSLGLVGWEMLSGHRPWEGENLYGIIYKQKHEELPRLTEMRQGIPTPLLFAIEGALDKHRDTRWADVDEFLAQLCEPEVQGTEARGQGSERYRPRPRGQVLELPAISVREPEPARPAAAEEQERQPGHPVAPAAFEPLRAMLEEQRATRGPSLFSQWGFARSKDTIDTEEDELEEQPRPARPFQHVRVARPSPRVVIAGALSLVILLAAVLASNATRGAPDGNGATLDPDSAVTTTTTGSLQTDTTPSVSTPPVTRDSAPAAAPAAPRRETTTPAAPEATPERTAPTGGRLLARSRIDSLLLCDSPVQTHQRACLFAHINQNDTALNRVYRDLIEELRARAGMRAERGEPESVTQLRGEQREWLAWRDQECRRRSRESEGQLWAPVRARCFVEFSEARTKELNGQLSRLRGG